MSLPTASQNTQHYQQAGYVPWLAPKWLFWYFLWI
jgi:hypothetical protein